MISPLPFDAIGKIEIEIVAAVAFPSQTEYTFGRINLWLDLLLLRFVVVGHLHSGISFGIWDILLNRDVT